MLSILSNLRTYEYFLRIFEYFEYFEYVEYFEYFEVGWEDSG